MGIENREYKFNREAEIEEMLGDIRNVGPAKPVGYLPIEEITDYSKSGVQTLISESKTRGLETRIFTDHVWPGYRGSLWVYDRIALQALLNKDREILVQAGWPTEADEFVAHLYVQEPIGTPLYKLIARAFGDKFSESLE